MIAYSKYKYSKYKYSISISITVFVFSFQLSLITNNYNAFDIRYCLRDTSSQQSAVFSYYSHSYNSFYYIIAIILNFDDRDRLFE